MRECPECGNRLCDFSRPGDERDNLRLANTHVGDGIGLVAVLFLGLIDFARWFGL